MNMKRSSWLLVALGVVVVGVVVSAALGQGARQATQLPLVTHDANDIYYLLDAKLTELSQKLDAPTEVTMCTKACLQRWEYLVDIGPAEPTNLRTQYLNGRGEAGWELVTAIWSQGESAWHYVFRRPLA